MNMNMNPDPDGRAFPGTVPPPPATGLAGPAEPASARSRRQAHAPDTAAPDTAGLDTAGRARPGWMRPALIVLLGLMLAVQLLLAVVGEASMTVLLATCAGLTSAVLGDRRAKRPRAADQPAGGSAGRTVNDPSGARPS